MFSLENSPSKTRKNYILLVIVVFTGFFIFGISENIKGPALPRIQSEFGMTEVDLGLVLSLNSIGYLLASFYTGFMVKKWGMKATTQLAFAIMCVSGLLLYISFNAFLFSGSYFVMYLGNGMLEIGLGILAGRIFTKNTGTMMNLSHFFYGLSSSLAPLAAAYLMGQSLFGINLGWRGMYLVMLSLSVLPMIPAFLARFPDSTPEQHEKVPVKRFMRDPVAWMVVFILIFGVLSELSIGGWLVNYLEKVYSWDPAAASGLLSAFFLTFTLGRLFLGPLTDKMGFVKSLFIFSGISGLCSIFGVLAGEPGAFLFALAGAGISPVYPTAMAFLSRRYQKDSDTAISFSVVSMGIGTVIGNFLVGAVIGLFNSLSVMLTGPGTGVRLGLQAGYLFIGACALICSLLAFSLFKRLKKRNELI